MLTFFVRRRFTQLQTFSVTQKSQRRPGACSQCASRVYKIPRVFPMHVRKLNRSNRPKFPRWPLPPLQGLPAQRAFGSSSSRPRKITRIASRPMYSLKRSTPLAKHLHASICSTYGPSISPYWRTSAGQKLFLYLTGAQSLKDSALKSSEFVRTDRSGQIGPEKCSGLCAVLFDDPFFSCFWTSRCYKGFVFFWSQLWCPAAWSGSVVQILKDAPRFVR